MGFDPDIHHRRSIRLKGYDYATPGAYFVTICTHERECLFGDIVDGVMQLNEAGRMVQKYWDALPDHCPHVELDVFVVMPNHVHGIIVLNNDVSTVGARHASPDFGVRMITDRATHASPLRGAGPKPRSIGAIVGSFKSAATKHINQTRNTPGTPIWQRNYYERMIRDDHEWSGIREYINHNPAQWVLDTDNPKNAP